MKAVYAFSRPVGQGFEIPADDFVEVLKLGDWENTSADICQHVDQKAFDRILKTFAAEKKAGGDNWPGILVDYDHFSHRTDRPSGAAAWIDDLQQRGDGLWAHFRFTTSGRALVGGGEYRLVSPVLDQFEPYDGAETERHLRPGRLVRVGLTNDPNMKGLKPASNRAGGATKDTTMSKLNHAEALKRLLGLAKEASDEDIQTAIATLEKDAEQDAGPNPDNDGDEVGEVENAAALEDQGGGEIPNYNAATNRAPIEDEFATADVGEGIEGVVAENRFLREQLAVLNRRLASTETERYAHLFADDETGEAGRNALASLFASNRDDAEALITAIVTNRGTGEAFNRNGNAPARQPQARQLPPLFSTRNRQVPPGNRNGASGTPNRANDQATFAKRVETRAQEIITANRNITPPEAWDMAVQEMEQAQ